MRGINERNRSKGEGTDEFCKQTTPSSHVSKKLSSKPSSAERIALSSSLSVNILDWLKILRDEYKDNNWYKGKKEGTSEREEKRISEERAERKENKKL